MTMVVLWSGGGEAVVVEWVDRNNGESFGLRRKNPPEKFSSGGAWWPATGELAGEDEWEREIWYPMIERIQGQRSNPRGVCEEDLEASSPAINRRLLSLTKRHLGVVLI
ncbi:hypothetical protein Tco_0268038 [Tanacetum coccineum]